ncbi:hypothetical protein LTR86_008141 [Recurvomyces mirabilis]|nr:hypothetical protein LTR86_008141 [Recurvomyces mirabilis]
MSYMSCVHVNPVAPSFANRVQQPSALRSFGGNFNAQTAAVADEAPLPLEDEEPAFETVEELDVVEDEDDPPESDEADDEELPADAEASADPAEATADAAAAEGLADADAELAAGELAEPLVRH